MCGALCLGLRSFQKLPPSSLPRLKSCEATCACQKRFLDHSGGTFNRSCASVLSRGVQIVLLFGALSFNLVQSEGKYDDSNNRLAISNSLFATVSSSKLDVKNHFAHRYTQHYATYMAIQCRRSLVLQINLIYFKYCMRLLICMGRMPMNIVNLTVQ